MSNEPSNIENADEARSLSSRSVERLVDSVHQPLEHAVVACLD